MTNKLKVIFVTVTLMLTTIASAQTHQRIGTAVTNQNQTSVNRGVTSNTNQTSVNRSTTGNTNQTSVNRNATGNTENRTTTVSWGVQGGLNLSNIRAVDGFGPETSLQRLRAGINIGILADFDIAPDWGIRSGLYFTTQGAHPRNVRTNDNGNGNGDGGTWLFLPYFQIPVHLTYIIDLTHLEPGTRIVFHAGPYIAAVLGGVRYRCGNRYKSGDFGLGFGVGVELGQFLTGMGWDIGLVDIATDINNRPSRPRSAKNRNFYLRVGYRF